VIYDLPQVREVVAALTEVRRSRGTQQKDVARRMATTRAWLCSIENGRTPDPHLSTIIRWIAALGVRASMTIYDPKGGDSWLVTLSPERLRRPVLLMGTYRSRETSMTNTPGPCGDNTCVQVELVAAGNYLATSTLGEDRGAVVYTPAEMATFLADVKAGKWDTLHTEARKLADEAEGLAGRPEKLSD
jgi:transcriptional regulator with XRE-family HTH domain